MAGTAGGEDDLEALLLGRIAGGEHNLGSLAGRTVSNHQLTVEPARPPPAPDDCPIRVPASAPWTTSSLDGRDGDLRTQQHDQRTRAAGKSGGAGGHSRRVHFADCLELKPRRPGECRLLGSQPAGRHCRGKNGRCQRRPSHRRDDARQQQVDTDCQDPPLPPG